MAKYVWVYLSVLASFVALDALWLGQIASTWYDTAIGHLMADTPSWPAALAFYLLYPIGLVIFGVRPGQPAKWTESAGIGALFGFFAYATYDLTNLAVLADWPIYISMLDIVWGSLLSGISAAAGRLCLNRLRNN